MQQFQIVPKIKMYDTANEFMNDVLFQQNDLIFVSETTREKYFKTLPKEVTIIEYRKYGQGEPTDIFVELIAKELEGIQYERVFAIGGGTILDVAKLFALKEYLPVDQLFEQKIVPKKAKELFLIPTTCGTGSEVTNISILELTKKQTKLGLAADALFPDWAILIPELIEELPLKVFATSSIDALIHATESFTSPKASSCSKLFSKQAIELIISTYQRMAKESLEVRKELSKTMILASTYAGIAFSNAGCAAVHAMSYPLGAKYHVPHGEANYAIFTQVYKVYQSIDPDGAIRELNEIYASLLACDQTKVYEKIEELLSVILEKKSLREYQVTLEDLSEFTDIVMTKQQRLMGNNYVVLSKEQVSDIYHCLY